MHGISHGLLKPEKIEAIVRSAQETVGVELLAEESAALRAVASEAHRALLAFKKAKARVEALSQDNPVTQVLAPEVGKATAAVLLADVGDPREFGSTRAYVKAYGLNLKERSSGTKKGQLSITKRGSGRARKYLWLAVHRWVKKDAIARAWSKVRAMVAGAKAIAGLMRKYAQALFHLARGAPFESARLFDTSRLALT
jgi:transposase